jgi:hypothetical protein
VGGGGQPQLRVYVNYFSLSTVVPPNNAPTAPSVLTADFVFSPTGTSTATFKWDPGSDDITPITGLRYEIQVATTQPPYSYTPPLAVNTPAPQSFPRVYDGNTRHGTVLISTNPWDPQSGTLTGLLTDTSYYYHVRTVDGGNLSSAWTADGTATDILWTGVAPAVSVLSVGSSVPGQATMTWTSAGDDATQGLLTGVYRVQYSTEPTTPWSASSTPAGAFTVDVTTSAQSPGSLQNVAVTGLSEGLTYTFVMWTRDDVGQWSAASTPVSMTIPVGVRSLTIDVADYNFGLVPLSASTRTVSAITVTYTGNIASTFRVSAATVTVGSPWFVAAAPGADAVTLYGLFAAAQPAATDFLAEDVLSTSSQGCTASIFAGDQTCVAVPSGTTRTLWFRLDMPLTSSTDQEQHIQVTVEAGPL